VIDLTDGERDRPAMRIVSSTAAPSVAPQARFED